MSSCLSLGWLCLITFAIGGFYGFGMGFAWRRHWDDWCHQVWLRMKGKASHD